MRHAPAIFLNPTAQSFLYCPPTEPSRLHPARLEEAAVGMAIAIVPPAVVRTNELPVGKAEPAELEPTRGA